MRNQSEANYPLFMAKYDDLSSRPCKKGDLLYVQIKDEEEWWFARSEGSSSEGYIPSFYFVPWMCMSKFMIYSI